MCLHSHETNNDTSIIFHGQKAKARWWYLLDDVGDAFAAGQPTFPFFFGVDPRVVAVVDCNGG